MTSLRALTQSLTALSIAGLVAVTSAAQAGCAATVAHGMKSQPAAPASTSSWRVRTVLRERPADRIASQVVVGHQRTLAALGNSGELLAVNAVSHVIYALGSHGVIAITPPRRLLGLTSQRACGNGQPGHLRRGPGGGD